MGKLKKSIRILFGFTIGSLIIFVIAMTFYPEKTSQLVGFRFYIVLTDSMEPTIPTNSFVMTNVLPKDAEIVPNSIITFKVHKGEKEYLYTHYFRETIQNDGNTFYITQPEGKIDEYDPYETTRNDIIGTYLFHIPYLGKILLFLKSPFGFIMYGELFVVFLINRLVLAKWEERHSDDDQRQHMITKNSVDVMDINQQVVDHFLIVSGSIVNHTHTSVQYVKARFTCFDDNKHKVYEETSFISDKVAIPTGEKRAFTHYISQETSMQDVVIHIIKYRVEK